MKNSLTQLKKDLIIGTQLILRDSKFHNKYINIPRYITKVQSNGVWLGIEKEYDSEKNSFLDFSISEKLVYKGNKFRIEYKSFNEKDNDENECFYLDYEIINI